MSSEGLGCFSFASEQCTFRRMIIKRMIIKGDANRVEK